MLQYYYHKDRGLNAALLEMARAAKFDAVALTVDTIVGGNRERCLHRFHQPAADHPGERAELRQQAALGARLPVPRKILAAEP
jgi:isopentenyl diphosphate isomerase/L-lactate dehydrogenase-like FMN-dependent dehydrogenase